jgi:hypothetical protein
LYAAAEPIGLLAASIVNSASLHRNALFADLETHCLNSAGDKIASSTESMQGLQSLLAKL